MSTLPLSYSLMTEASLLEVIERNVKEVHLRAVVMEFLLGMDRILKAVIDDDTGDNQSLVFIRNEGACLFSSRHNCPEICAWGGHLVNNVIPGIINKVDIGTITFSIAKVYYRPKVLAGLSVNLSFGHPDIHSTFDRCLTIGNRNGTESD